MRKSGYCLLGLALIISASNQPIVGQEKPLLPPADRAPHLILAHAGPHAPVRALAFSPDAKTLYVGGFDKQVRRYELIKGKYEPAGTIRIPIGPGNAGVVNALAVSPDGKWVAAAGRAPMRGESWAAGIDGIDEDSRRLPLLQREDLGVIYLFDPTNPDGGKVIRGQQSEVRALAFANPEPATGHALVSAGIEWNAKGEYLGSVRVFNVATGAERGEPQIDLPATAVPPGLAAWPVGPDNKELRVAVAWDAADGLAGKLFLWTGNTKPERLSEGAYNSTLAVRVEKGAAAEIITGGFQLQQNGALTVRPAAGGEPKIDLLGAAGERLLLPVGLAALDVKGVGNATAVLLRMRPAGETVGWQHELRLLTPTGAKSIPLAGVIENRKPVLTASPDGQFIAVAGFIDNRVEVYNAADFAAGKAVPEKLAGDPAGFGKVAFLVGAKIWLGGRNDTPDTGGVVLDLDRNARVAAAVAKDVVKVDAPAAAGEYETIKPANNAAPWRVAVTVGGVKQTLDLLPGESPTAVAVLPGKPVWDATLGAVVAVAHIHDFSQTVQITLYNHATGKSIFRLGGPTLPVRSLAFSATRAVLAGAGEDGTVAVWSLKNIARRLPTIEGLLVAAREGTVVVTVVQPDSKAFGKLKPGNVIESVADAKGVQQPVKTPIDFLLAVRALEVGANAQVKVKGQAAVAVPIGTMSGFRHPLFTLWVDPVAKAGPRDWVAWTSSGPYDTSGEGGEARIGWLTATGDPARPVTFAGAKQYRKMFYKPDFIGLLLKTADYNEAVAQSPQPTRPTLTARPVGVEPRDGLLVVREKLDGVEVSVNDPDTVLDLDRAELRWQVTGPGGASGWKKEPLAAARVTLDVSKHDWKRGEHRIHVKLFKSGDAPADATPVDEGTLLVGFVPPPPVLIVLIDGKPPAAGVEIKTENAEVEVTASVDAKGNPDGANVALSWTDSGKPEELARNPNGTFGLKKVTLKDDATTVILVTATNRGTAKAEDESHTIEVRVRKITKVVPPPGIKLLVVTPYDFRTVTNAPYIVSTQQATVTATVEDKSPVTAFDWKIGDAEWEAGKLDAKTNSQTREIKLPPTDKPLLVQVRAKVAKSEFGTDSALIIFEEMPAVSVTIPPAQVTQPELKLGGGLKVTSKRPFKVRVLVKSARTGQTREFDPTVDPTATQWEAGLTLFPGVNLLGYVIKYDNDRKELRKADLIEVHYLRPPLVAGGSQLDVGTGTAGDLSLGVLSSPDSAPTELWVNGTRLGFRTQPQPVKLFGVGLWVMTARGVTVQPGAERLKPVQVEVRNAERGSQPVSVEVIGGDAVKVDPPVIRLEYNGGLIVPNNPLDPVGKPDFTFSLKVKSRKRLTRLELWQGTGADTGQELVGGIAAGDEAGVGDNFELNAQPTLRLRPGTANYVRVVATSDGETTAVAFNVSYAAPPVRVVIDSITEPNGKPIPVVAGSAGEYQVVGGIIDVQGRVEWSYDDDPIAQDRNLTMVFVANGVAHLPVLIPLAREVKDGKEVRARKFTGRVYLNSLDPNPKARGTTRIRAELRSGSRPVPIPQLGLEQAAISVTSQNPLRRQRLHVLMLGVEVPEAQRRNLVRRVIMAVGGSIPADNPNFTEGRFDRKDFEFAYLYSPRLGYTKAGDLNALLNAVRADIERRTKRPGEEWVNDVIVLYYQGEDWVEKDGRWFLHSATTLNGAAGKNPGDYAIRLDNVPQIPGLPVAVVNVTSRFTPGDNLALDMPYLRYGWADPAALNELLGYFGEAIQSKRTWDEMRAHVGTLLSLFPEAKRPTRKGQMPNELLARVFGLPF